MLPLVFSHANSFPPATYRLLFALLRQRGCETHAVDSFGHDPRYPVSNNWPHLVQQLADFARAEVERLGEPVFFVGHSLGGFLSVMAAALHPELARGVLLIDAPLISGWRATTLGMAKRTQLVGSVSPGKVSQRRRYQWADNDEAIAYFRAKKAFAQWHPEVLQDYVENGLQDQQGKRVLAFDRAIETAIYNTLPHNLDALLRRHPLRCPAAFIGGLGSQELRQVGLEMTLRITQGRSMMLDGSHLFPMERPEATAAAIEASLLNLVSVRAA
ncbi:MAG: alpha/beta hydrolase [Comamonas sp.]